MVTHVAETLRTDRKKLKRAKAECNFCQEAERFLSLTLDLFFVAGLDGYLEQLNPVWERVLGFSTEELLSRPWLELVHPEDRSSTSVNLNQLAAGQSSVSFENRYLCKDGSYKWLFWKVMLCQEQQLIYAMAHDQTKSKRSQAAQLESEESLLQKAEEDLEEMVRERTADLTRLNDQLKEEIAQHKLTESQLRQSEARLKNRVKQCEQESEQAKSLLKELQTNQATLIQTEKMLSLRQIVAGIAHEINNPVSFIYGNIDYASCYFKDLMNLVKLYGIHYPQPAPQIQEEVEVIDLDFMRTDLPKLLSSMKVGATRIRQVVLALQKFLTAEQLEMKATDLHEGLESILLILQHRLKATVERPDITVVENYGDLPLVDCYAGQINQVFINLITNAIDALEESTKIWNQPRCIKISTSVEEIKREGSDKLTSHALIRIADNGPGMSESIDQRIFEECFTTKAVGKGTGLGLLISYQIVVEKHRGLLSYTSQAGKGAEFTVALPLQQRG